MSRDKQMINDLIEIFDEEYGKRNLITAQNTAEKMTAKGYRKSTDLAEEIFAEIEQVMSSLDRRYMESGNPKQSWGVRGAMAKLAELKNKYTEEGK